VGPLCRRVAIGVRRLAVFLALLSGASCGVGGQSSPHILSRTQVPFGLLETTTSTTTEARPSQAMLTVYLVSAGHLVAVNRMVPTPVSLSGAIDALLAGPTWAEAATGITTDIPAGTELRSVRVEGNNAVVDFSDALATVSGQSQILALAQVVFTATEMAQVDGVSIELDGTPTEVPSQGGTLLDRPATRRDYATLAPGIVLSGA